VFFKVEKTKPGSLTWTFSYTSLVIVRNGNSVVASKNFADLTKGVGINLNCSNNTSESHRRLKDLGLGRIIILNWKLKEMKSISVERSRVP
jgi:hypothetical protein